ncbi:MULTISPECIES: LuxR C-terminal-related transcriptional regulator [unclassified Methylophaga]|mgnify:CR=1 FL=1|jgi:DNA-binding CsgD family transcriptional regulator|uniref:LuxR C-terminal-related transcriptional regulator n=1 Tax=unclassified Methylophaga TaxID=2629249 RepID=UPI00259C9D00|nr:MULTISPECIES: LuxR C-terminal-related transcriptional regulator [unclassified Methylophaga]|tara:strand:+ start:2765 stop:3163 length:399 start_codon:yes stop_codon:yes gene_type:complete
MKKLHAVVIDKGPLSKTEAITLGYLCEGYTRIEIAEQKRFRSRSTINRQVESIAYKLEARNQAEIVSTAIALNMVRLEFREPHSLLKKLLLVLVMTNITAGHIDMRRGPRAPRPVRTVRVTSRVLRTARQYP